MKGDGDINRRVINPLEWKALIKDFKKEYGFDLEKDLKNVNMTSYEFVKILKDLSFDINSNPIKGNKVTSIPPISVYKMRYKDEYRHIGTSNAYRFHLYHKTSPGQISCLQAFPYGRFSPKFLLRVLRHSPL